MTEATTPGRGLRAAYWVATGLMCATMLYSAGMYFVATEEVREAFRGLGYPDYLVIPLAVAKVLGVVAILTRLSPFLTGLAYAGFFYDVVLALTAHLVTGDDEALPAALGILFVVSSYALSRKAFGPTD